MQTGDKNDFIFPGNEDSECKPSNDNTSVSDGGDDDDYFFRASSVNNSKKWVAVVTRC